MGEDAPLQAGGRRFDPDWLHQFYSTRSDHIAYHLDSTHKIER